MAKYIIEEITEPSGGGCGGFIKFVFWMFVILFFIKMCAH